MVVAAVILVLPYEGQISLLPSLMVLSTIKGLVGTTTRIFHPSAPHYPGPSGRHSHVLRVQSPDLIARINVWDMSGALFTTISIEMNSPSPRHAVSSRGIV